VAPARPALLRQRRLPGAGLCVSGTLSRSRFRARWIKPAAGFSGNHIYVTDGINAFDYHGLSAEQRLLALVFRRGRRFFPGWDAALVDLPADVLISEHRSRQIEGLWLREPKQFLHDALPRAHNFLDGFGDIRRRLTASASCTSRGAE